VWNHQSQCNLHVEEQLQSLHNLSKQDLAEYTRSLSLCASLPFDKVCNVITSIVFICHSLFQKRYSLWAASSILAISLLLILNCCINSSFQWNAQGKVGKTLYETRLAFLEARTSFRKMGEIANVPLEPPCQTRLADATSEVYGVLAAGVPGGLWV
jgi:hypothetical protein